LKEAKRNAINEWKSKNPEYKNIEYYYDVIDDFNGGFFFVSSYFICRK
jgi:hypothetical protein